MPTLMSKYKASSLNGYVEFQLPHISHPSFGQVTISGRFPHIQPHLSRPVVDPSIPSGLIYKYTELVAECGLRPASFERACNITSTVTCAIQLTLYWNPTLPLDSKGFTFYAWLLLFAWFFDNALEDGWFSGRLTLRDAQSVHETYIKIMRRQEMEDQLPEIEGLPNFHGICKVLERMVSAGVDFMGDDYLEYIEPFVSTFQVAFLSDDWFTCCRLDKRFSLRTYNAWRQWNCGAEVCLEGQLLVRGIRISQNIRRHPIFKRIMTILRANLVWVNDILGAGKDFSSTGPNHPDNELLFRVLEKGEAIQDVVDDMCFLIGEELHDLIYLKQALLDIFGEDENIVGFLEIIEVMIDGQFNVYIESIRYKCNRGYVRILRDGEEKQDDPNRSFGLELSKL